MLPLKSLRKTPPPAIPTTQPRKITFTIRSGSTTATAPPPKPPRPTITPQRPPRPTTGTPQRPQASTDAVINSSERKPTAPSSASRNAVGATNSSSVRRPAELTAVGAAVAPVAQPRSAKTQSVNGENYVAVPEDHPLRQHGPWWTAPSEAPWATMLPELGSLSGWSYSSQSVGFHCGARCRCSVTQIRREQASLVHTPVSNTLELYLDDIQL